MKTPRSRLLIFTSTFLLGSASIPQVLLACPGGNASIQIATVNDPEKQVHLGACTREGCRAALEQLEAGKSAILRYSDDRWVRIEPMGNGLFRAIIQRGPAGYPTPIQVVQGTLSLGSGMRGGCGSEIEIVS